MTIPLVIAGVLTFLAFLAHSFFGDRELLDFEPKTEAHSFSTQIKWTMSRGAWHMVSWDLLFSTVLIALLLFTSYFNNTKTVLLLLSIYYFGYGLCFFIGISISKPIPRKFLLLPQWILMLVISVLLTISWYFY